MTDAGQRPLDGVLVVDLTRHLPGPYASRPFDAEDACLAGELAGVIREAGLSLADRACLALAGRLGVPAVTADRTWLSLDIGVEVIGIR